MIQMTKKRTFKNAAALLSVALCVLMFAGMASAHVTVQPPQVAAGTYQVMAVRVPSEEKGVNTVKVQVKVPAEINVSRVEPKEGWKYELEKDADSKITSITWSSEVGLSETEFTEFRVSGKVADDAKQLQWKAYQTYSDGTLVEWVGGEGADKPASVTTVTPAPAEGAADSHGQGAAASNDANDNDESDNNLPLILSIVAVALGALSLIVSLARKKR
ncbi:YcnI family copper-binding membrane protein [Paenibacillus kobensis]|uniref:YcnI family copper-binding membrane protein n=1 Tax=Paenibacillus kobensis TaxID=59841 RepID=UPI0027D8281D|nr:YcnI family protein [Paenibacillus kobensis]